MTFDAHGYCRIKNIKANIYIGRSPFEDASTDPKSFVPLKSDEVKDNSIFEYNLGINGKLWEFHSLHSGVAITGEISIGTPEPRPAAFIEKYVKKFEWEVGGDKSKTL